MRSANIAFRPLRGNAIAVVVLMGVALLPLPAGAEGALAVSFPKKPGEWSMGWAMNWVSPGAAHREALDSCRQHALTDDVRSRCTVISDIHRECVSTAAGEIGFGWGIDQDLEAARQQALDMCKTISGADAEACEVAMERKSVACDSSDRGR